MKRKHKVTLQLPPEFIDLCQRDQVEPDVVLRGFIADLCGIVSWADNPRADGYASNGPTSARWRALTTSAWAIRTGSADTLTQRQLALPLRSLSLAASS